MVKLVKLVTGDEVVTDLIVDGNNITLNKPVKVMLMPDGSAGMMPLLALSKDEKVTIDKAHVIFVVDPDDELLNIYNSRFGNGLVMPPSGLDLGTLDLGDN